MDNLDIDTLKRCAPVGVKDNIDQPLVDKINVILSDPDIRDEYRDNVLGCMTVMQNSQFNFRDYIYAVKYVSYKLRGDTNNAAYAKTFPERVKNHVARGYKDYSAWVSAYAKNRFVIAIRESTLIPTHILNADVYQKAINVQAELMVTATSETVRQKAADSLMTQLKAPETTKIELDMNVKQDDSIGELRSAALKLVNAQRLAITSGENTARDIAHSSIIEAEVIN